MRRPAMGSLPLRRLRPRGEQKESFPDMKYKKIYPEGGKCYVTDKTLASTGGAEGKRIIKRTGI